MMQSATDLVTGIVLIAICSLTVVLGLLTFRFARVKRMKLRLIEEVLVEEAEAIGR